MLEEAKITNTNQLEFAVFCIEKPTKFLIIFS